MALTFLESELRLALKDLETIRRWQLHYLGLAEELLRFAGQWGHDPETQAAFDAGADLCAAQAKRLGQIAEQRQHLEGAYLHQELVAARHQWRMRMERLEREEQRAA